MFTLFDRDARRNRRDFLRIGGSAAIGAAGVTLSDLATLRARAESIPGMLTGKSVIFLFLHGGPSQFETFDPKMGMPSGIRSATGELATSIPGVTFGGSLPRLAAMADRLNVVRSYVPGDANHDLKPIVGRDSSGANLGAMYSQVAGTNDPRSGLPTNVVLFPRAVDPSTRPVTTSFGHFTATGPFSSVHAPYDPSVGEGMKLAVPRERLDDRRALRTSLEGIARGMDRGRALEGVDGIWEQAHRLLTGGLADAFDLGREDPRVLARYDTAPLVRPEAISKRWKNHKNYTDNAKSLGKLLLLARRLCERGCGFVTVTTNFVWDMHADENNATMEEGMRYMGPPLDHAVSAFVEDLHARGLDEKILLVACGEMGRSPRINAQGGRDHWGPLGPLLLAGGGMPAGQVVGLSNRDGSAPQSAPVTNRNLIATIIHTLFDVAQLRLVPNLPREFSQAMLGWEPIPGLQV